MKLLLTDDNGNELKEFLLPKTEGITTEQAHKMGETVAKAIQETAPQLEAYERRLEETCTCFWKDKSPEERKVFRQHSSECAVWEMDQQ